MRNGVSLFLAPDNTFEYLIEFADQPLIFTAKPEKGADKCHTIPEGRLGCDRPSYPLVYSQKIPGEVTEDHFQQREIDHYLAYRLEMLSGNWRL